MAGLARAANCSCGSGSVAMLGQGILEVVWPSCYSLQRQDCCYDNCRL